MIKPISYILIFCSVIFFQAASFAESKNKDPCQASAKVSDKWYDIYHAFLSTKFCEPAVAFDNFFGDDRSLEEELPGNFVRWRNEFVWNESDRLAFHTGLRAKVRLPQISQRLKLIIEGDHDDDFANPLGDLPQGSTAEDQPLPDRELSDSTVGLQYDIQSERHHKTSFDVRVKTRLPLQLHSNFKYRYTHPFGNHYLFRFTETLYWKEWEGFGETSRFDLEKLVNPRTLGRGSVSFTFSEISQGVDWKTSLGFSHKISAPAGLRVDLVTSGITRPNTLVTNYGIITKYRRNMFRKWFFFEFIPEVNWPRDEKGHYEGVTTLTLRFDIQFWDH